MPIIIAEWNMPVGGNDLDVVTRYQGGVAWRPTTGGSSGPNIIYAANGGFSGAVSFADNSSVTQINLATYAVFTNLDGSLSNAGITSLDVSNCTALVALNLSGDIGITSLDLSGSGLSVPPTGFGDLASLVSLDISNMSNLTEFGVTVSTLASITTDNTPLTSLTITGNSALTSLNLSLNPELTILLLSTSALSSVNLSANTLLTSLNVTSSIMTVLDLIHNTLLTNLSVDAPLNTLSLSNNTILNTIFIGDTNLTTLSIAQSTNWISVEIQDNSLLTTINPPASFPAVNDFQVDGNALTQANVNALLVLLAANSVSNGTADFSGGTNAAPSGAGATAVTTLTGRGWTVNTN